MTMNAATKKLYSDSIPGRLRRECFDYAMAFGCPMCECDITEASATEYVTVAGQPFPILGLKPNAEVVQLCNANAMGVLEDRYVAVCGKCYPQLSTTDGINKLTTAVN